MNPPRHRQPWTESDDKTLYMFYQKKGADWCAQRLGRTRDGVRHRFKRHITPLEDRDIPPHRRLIPTPEAAFMCDSTPGDIRAAARRRGVLVEMASKHFVPFRWAERYARQLKSWQEAESMSWYNQEKVEKIFGLAPGSHARSITEGKHGIGFAFIERVRYRRGYPSGKTASGNWVFRMRYHPWDVEGLARDVSRFEPVLTDRQAALLALLRRGYTLLWQRTSWAFYIVELEDRVFGPLPQYLVRWLIQRGMIWKKHGPRPDLNDRWGMCYYLTREGHTKAVEIEKDGRVDDLLNGGGEEVLDSAA